MSRRPSTVSPTIIKRDLIFFLAPCVLYRSFTYPPPSLEPSATCIVASVRGAAASKPKYSNTQSRLGFLSTSTGDHRPKILPRRLRRVNKGGQPYTETIREIQRNRTNEMLSPNSVYVAALLLRAMTSICLCSILRLRLNARS